MTKQSAAKRQKKEYVCSECSTKWNYASELKRHMAMHADPHLKCDQCDMLCRSEKLLRSHKRIHQTERPFKCTKCEMAFKVNFELTRHMTIHDKILNYVCPTCGKETYNAGLLRVHMESHRTEKTFCCDKCPSTFKGPRGLRQHKVTHMSDQPYFCGQCGSTFKTITRLKEHMITHAVQRPYKCDVCDKYFKSSKHMYAHKHRVHSDNRYQCTYVDDDGLACTLVFTSDTYRHIHVSTHYPERPFECTHVSSNGVKCRSTFKVYSGLHQHLDTHVTERTFPCDYVAGCTYTGTTKRHLRNHIRQTHNKVFIVSCPHDGCTYQFTHEYYLNKHLRVHTLPKCVKCNKYAVAEQDMKCGSCVRNYRVKERSVFKYLAGCDWRLNEFVRDQHLGCGVRRRPDGYVNLHINVSTANILVVLEVDEFFHRGNTVQCELVRLEQIQMRHGGALFVIRYNPDQPDGLSDAKLQELAKRCVDILDYDHMDAIEAFGGLFVEYHGYSDKRVQQLDRAWFESQILIERQLVDDDEEDEDEDEESCQAAASSSSAAASSSSSSAAASSSSIPC